MVCGDAEPHRKLCKYVRLKVSRFRVDNSSMANSQFTAVADYKRLYDRNAISHSIRTAVRIGVIEALDEGQKDLEQLAKETATDKEVLKLLLDVLVNTELVERYAELYALSTVARLIPPQFADFGDLYWCHLENYVRGGVALPDNEELPHTQADFLASSAAMEWLTTPAAIDAASVLDIGTTRTGLRILEIGCGSAIFGSTFVHRDSDSRLVLLDDRSNLKRAEKTIESIGAQNRVQYVEADYMQLELDHQPFDMVIAAGLAHRHSEEQCQELFKLVHKHLKPNGEFVVVDAFPGQQEGDTTRSIMALEIALRTQQGGLHDPAHFQHLMIMNGYDQIQFAHLPAPPHIWGLVLAQRN